MDKPVRMDSRHAFRKSREERPVHPCTRDFVFSLATCGSLVVLGSWSLTAVGCAAGTKTNEQRISQRRNMNPVTPQQIAAKEAAKNAAQGVKNTTKSGQPVATLSEEVALEPQSGTGAWDQRVTAADHSSVSNDFRFAPSPVVATAELAAGRPLTAGMVTSATEPQGKTYLPNGRVGRLSALLDPMVMQPELRNTPNFRKGVGGGPKSAVAIGSRNEPRHLQASVMSPLDRATSLWAPSAWVGPMPAGAKPSVPSVASAAVTTNGELTIAQAGGQTDTAALSSELARAFAQASEGSMDPLKVWFIYASLAVSNPDITLPDGWSNDLLPAERERVAAAHAGFVALGRAFRDGAGSVSPAIRSALVAALTGEPQLTIPKVDLCTKVTGYGDYAPLQRRSFLAGSSNRVIVYSELDGFRSQLENGKWTTRLATRVSIVPASTAGNPNGNSNGNSNFVAWSRTPEWTEVTDTSNSPRSEFFLGEIIPIASNLSAGNYNVRVEVKDLVTGAITSQILPIEVLDERAFAAVSD